MPSTPRNFTGSASGATVTLAWNAPLTGTPFYYYQLDVGFQSGTYVVSVPVGLLTTVSADIADGVYYFRVRAVNAAGPGASSPEVVVAVGAGAGLPDAPQNLAAGVLIDSLTLTWDPPNQGLPLTGYVLSVGMFPGTANVIRQPIGTAASTVSFSTSGLPPATYFIRVSAVNAFGEGPPSNEVSLTLTGGGPPSAPRNVVASLVNDMLTLTWDPPASGGAITSYVLLVGAYPGITSIRHPVGAALSFSASQAGAPPQTFYIRVAAINTAGEGPPSAEVTITVGGGSAPGPPQNATGGVAGDVVTLTWLPPASGAPILAYRVYIGTYTGALSILIGSVSATSFTVPWVGAPPGTYFFNIVAVNAVGAGPPAEVAVAFGSGAPPTAPQGLEAGAVNDVLTLMWYGPYVGNTPLTGFVLYVGTSPGAADVLRQSLGVVQSVSAPIAGATPGLYYFRVTAVNAFGEGPPSADVSVVIGNYCAVPSAPVLTGSSAGTVVSLSWTTPAGGPITGYTLFVSAGPGLPYQPVGDAGLVNAISGPASPGTYSVRVAASAPCGLGAASNTVVLTVP